MKLTISFLSPFLASISFTAESVSDSCASTRNAKFRPPALAARTASPLVSRVPSSAALIRHMLATSGNHQND
eukprot:CAMPEP_0172745218 /NCGR_PEP_ID=MMETSP1074-20121228/137401_1 /TAXON_ID=2916 /ORGANISM="Ceratium fusus, Strain PA161109" /LENGTH=71 /DNA_ID=CAMNT_0013576337 /DNA_START=98 /DNA_END=310 /DNA_ORIENTATION=-